MHMSFIRPEAMAAIRLYAEPVVYAAAGVFFGVRAIQLLATGAWTGAVMGAVGVLSIFAFYGAVRRMVYRRRFSEPGPGVVTVHEGRITYFGPLGGAAIARDGLVEIAIERGADSAVHWVLTDEARQIIAIPAGAKDAHLLLDVLGPLQGFDQAALVSLMGDGPPGRAVLWHRWSMVGIEP